MGAWDCRGLLGRGGGSCSCPGGRQPSGESTTLAHRGAPRNATSGRVESRHRTMPRRRPDPETTAHRLEEGTCRAVAEPRGARGTCGVSGGRAGDRGIAAGDPAGLYRTSSSALVPSHRTSAPRSGLAHSVGRRRDCAPGHRVDGPRERRGVAAPARLRAQRAAGGEACVRLAHVRGPIQERAHRDSPRGDDPFRIPRPHARGRRHHRHRAVRRPARFHSGAPRGPRARGVEEDGRAVGTRAARRRRSDRADAGAGAGRRGAAAHGRPRARGRARDAGCQPRGGRSRPHGGIGGGPENGCPLRRCAAVAWRPEEHDVRGDAGHLRPRPGRRRVDRHVHGVRSCRPAGGERRSQPYAPPGEPRSPRRDAGQGGVGRGGARRGDRPRTRPAGHRHVHVRHRAGGRGRSRGPAGGRHDFAGDRRPAHGPAQCAGPASARSWRRSAARPSSAPTRPAP